MARLLEDSLQPGDLEAMKQKLYQACGGNGGKLAFVIEEIQQSLDMI